MEILKKTAALRVAAQTKDKAPDEVTTISLSGLPLLPDLLLPFTHLTELTLVGMKPKLTSLNALPDSLLATLLTLDVADNAITINELPPACPELRTCKMGNNKITSIDEVRLLAEQMPKLTLLDLEDNVVCKKEGNFQVIFDLFPSLQALNYRNRDGVEMTEEDSDEEDEEEESDEESDDGLIASSSADEEDESNDSGSDEEEDEDDNSEELTQPTKKARTNE